MGRDLDPSAGGPPAPADGDAGDRAVVDADAVPDVAADRIARAIEAALAERDRALIALAGGSTPRAAYERLATRPLPWAKVDVFFGDERAVPPDHPDSNFRMAREALLDRVPIPTDRIHRMEAERRDREAAAAEYAARLPERLDLLLLGVGEDGHTASLFPGSDAVEERARKVVAVEGPKPPRQRLTITPVVIGAARTVLVLATGPDKAPAVARALHGPRDPVACPAQLARSGTWILDHAAAAGPDGGSP